MVTLLLAKGAHINAQDKKEASKRRPYVRLCFCLCT